MVRVDAEKLRLLGVHVASLQLRPLEDLYKAVASTVLTVPSDSRVLRDNTAMEIILTMDHEHLLQNTMPAYLRDRSESTVNYAYALADAIIKKSNEEH